MPINKGPLVTMPSYRSEHHGVNNASFLVFGLRNSAYGGYAEDAGASAVKWMHSKEAARNSADSGL